MWSVQCNNLWLFDLMLFFFLSYVNIIIIVQTKTVYPELDILFLRAELFSSNDKKKHTSESHLALWDTLLHYHEHTL